MKKLVWMTILASSTIIGLGCSKTEDPAPTIDGESESTSDDADVEGARPAEDPGATDFRTGSEPPENESGGS